MSLKGQFWVEFNKFVVGTTTTASQLEFIDLIVQYLTENGVTDAARLYRSPFTDISQQGPEALFLPARVTEIVRVLEDHGNGRLPDDDAQRQARSWTCPS